LTSTFPAHNAKYQSCIRVRSISHCSTALLSRGRTLLLRLRTSSVPQ